MTYNKTVVIKDIHLYHIFSGSILVGPEGQMFVARNMFANPSIVQLPNQLVYKSTFDGVGTNGDIEIPEWLAEKKGLIQYAVYTVNKTGKEAYDDTLEEK